MSTATHTMKKVFDGLQVLLASPEDIKAWSHGSVENSDTINYRTGKPKQKGLFCEAIFGPMKNFECGCGKYKGVRYKGIVCERCGVEVTTSRVRRERMGHIELAAPVVHIWYIKATPSRVGLLLNLSVNEIEKILYYVKYVVTAVNEKQKKHIITSLEKDYHTKIEELDGLYADEQKNLADGASSKKAKEVAAQEDELKRLYMTNKAELEKEYSRVKSILANLKVGSTILESDYRNVFYRYETAFTFVSGSQAVLNLLKQVDIEATIKELIAAFPRSKGEERKKMFKKLKLLINLYISGVKPEWMVLTHLPVIPPDLRPVVQLEGGKFASSDVNQFYRRVLMRNLRLKRMIQVGMPDVVKKNEIRLLQESVNNLLVWEKVEAGKGSGAKVFKSLTDMLSGKEGIFRKNLLGKRVDYSGRSVITVGPNLQLDECGLPLYIAVKIFTPFIIGKLIERKIAHTPKQAEKLIKDEHPVALSILEEVIKDKYVLLNRAPTLHRLSIQAFKIKLMPGKTVRVHPLVCPAFNADFDGDQMAVHLPLSEEAQFEAQTIISSAQNVLAPASGEPVITHSQDMVLGIYYLTDDSRNETIVANFADMQEALASYHAQNLHIHDSVRVKIDGEYITTTLWRVVFHSILPQSMKFRNEKIGKKSLKKILDEIYDMVGRESTVRVADAIKEMWFMYATASSTTINVFDFTVPAKKQELIHAADEKVSEISNLRWRGFLSDDEKHRLIIQLRWQVNAEIAKLVKVEYKPGSSLYRMIDSGARGTWGQLTQVSGMKGLVVSPSGEIIELPVKSSLLEGFRPIEYFISAHSARKGKADTALRTAESGYLTRRLVDASQEVVIREFDCMTTDAIYISKDEAELRQEKFEDLLFGRVLADDLRDTRGVVIAHAWTMIEKNLLKLIQTEQFDMIKVRSPLTCKTTSWVCQQCFGMDLSSRHLVEIGTPIGVISSQSIGEPGTQLTMRTFHQEKSLAEWDITHGIRRVEELFEVRNPKRPAIIAPFDGKIVVEEGVKKTDIEIVSEPMPKTYIIKEWYATLVSVGDMLNKGWSYAEKGKSRLMVKEEGKVLEVHSDYLVLGTVQRVKKKLAVGTSLKVKHGAEVFKGQLLSSGQIDIREYMVVVSDLEAQRYIVKEIKKVYTSQGQNVNDKYMEVIIKQLFSKVVIEDTGNSSFVPGSLVKYEEFAKVNEQLKSEGKILAKGTRLALWLTNIAKETDSWLSAASFQETIRVMVEASTKGSVDRLDDLKSNVILGRLLPVGNEFRKRYMGGQWVEEVAHIGAETVVDEIADEEVVDDVVGSYATE
jgi:DNA-directed RNA polymerase subunit beta'